MEGVQKERLRHIFKKQVYGLAPTEIIYKIATSYILGFDETLKLHESEHNFRQLDALSYAKDGTLEKKLDEISGKGIALLPQWHGRFFIGGARRSAFPSLSVYRVSGKSVTPPVT